MAGDVKAEEVEAEVIETDVSHLSGADRWLAEMRGKVEKTASEHHAYEIENAEMLAQARRERTAIRKDIAEIDNERKALTRVLDDAVKRFRNDVKGVLKPLTDLDEAYKAEIDAYSERAMRNRRHSLEEKYRELAPLMAIPSEDGRALVPFDRLLERYGMGQLGKKWLMASTNDREAELELISALEQIQEYEAVIRHSVAPSDVDVALSIYFDTLDMTAALSEADKRKRQRDRLAALEQERREIEAWEREQREPEPVAVPIPAPVEEAEPVPIPAPAPVAPTPILASAQRTSPVPPREWFEYVFVGYCDESQAKALQDWCKANGIGRLKVLPTNGRQFTLSATMKAS